LLLGELIARPEPGAPAARRTELAVDLLGVHLLGVAGDRLLNLPQLLAQRQLLRIQRLDLLVELVELRRRRRLGRQRDAELTAVLRSAATSC